MARPNILTYKGDGTLQYINDTEFNGIAEVVLEKYATTDGVGNIYDAQDANSTYTSLGTFTDTRFQGAVGSGDITILSTTTTLYQDLSSNYGSVTNSPIHWDADQGVMKIADDNDLNDLADDIISYMIDNDGPGTYTLAETAPSGGTWQSIASINNINDESTTTTFNLYKKIAGEVSLTQSPLRAQGSSIKTMSQSEIEQITEKVRERIVTNNIGQYVFQAAAPGTGTWANKGTITDTRPSTAATNYAGPIYTSTTDYTGAALGSYDGSTQVTYTGDYVRNDLVVYNAEYIADYQNTYAGTRSVSYTGAYTGEFNASYTGTIPANYTGTYTGNFNATYTGTTPANYTGVYTGEFNASYTGTTPANYTGSYAGEFIGNYQGPGEQSYVTLTQFAGTVNYQSDYVGTRIVPATYTRIFPDGVTYTRNFAGTVNYSGSRTTPGSFSSPVNYASLLSYTGERAFTGFTPGPSFNFFGYVGNYEGPGAPGATYTLTYVGQFYYGPNPPGTYLAGPGVYDGPSFAGTPSPVNYLRVYVATYEGPGTPTSYFRALTFSGGSANYTGTVSYAGTRTTTSNFAGSINYLGGYSRDVTGNYYGTTTSGPSTFTSLFGGTVNYQGSRTYTGPAQVFYLGNYAGSRNESFTGVTPANYTTTYTSTQSETFTGVTPANYTTQYVSTQSETFTGVTPVNYTTTYTSVENESFTGTTTGNFVGTYSTAYFRDFIGNYVGATYLGDYTGTVGAVYEGPATAPYTGLIDYQSTYGGSIINSDSTTISTKTLWRRIA